MAAVQEISRLRWQRISSGFGASCEGNARRHRSSCTTTIQQLIVAISVSGAINAFGEGNFYLFGTAVGKQMY
ncbi:hypothetical protein R1flu_027339 [Riccia fluitans]|uniref:Uncharacterized protein n=1 Tax=Riccia fluitans TaxID=41844 RepID=A0ABD1XIL1_9MARC